MKTQPVPIAYSYTRFSSPEQAKGDSLRRQTEATEAWCERNNVCLDTSLTLHDKGVSAFKGLHRENPDKHALALLLKLVERGRVRPGDYLVIENLDRLSREHEVAACNLLTGILMSGVKVVQLSPYEMVLTEQSNGWELMRAVMELSRGHGESVLKSDRVGKAWRKRLAMARQGEVVLTKVLPAWIEERNGKLHLIPEATATLKLIFHLTASGYGQKRIVRKLTEEGVPPIGTSGHWSRSYINKLVRDERVLGRFQPRKVVHKKDGTKVSEPEGDPIGDYFPAAISQQEWDMARAGSPRKPTAGRTSKHVNIFAGMINNARDGCGYYCATRLDRGQHKRVLLNTNGVEGRTQVYSFPFATFERALLSMLREVNPSEVMGETNGQHEVMALSGEKARLETRYAELDAELEDGEIKAVARKLREVQERIKGIDERLAEIQRQQAKPMSEAWGEIQTLAAALDSAADPEDFRLRLRSALRHVVDEIWLLVEPVVRTRYAHVQVWFKASGGSQRSRDYLIVHKPPCRGTGAFYKPGQWVAVSFGLATPEQRGSVPDLRQYQHVAEVREWFMNHRRGIKPAVEEVFAAGQKHWEAHMETMEVMPDASLLSHEDWGPFVQCGFITKS